MFVLKNADCLGQDLDPAAGHYAQKDMPNLRRVALLELIRLKLSGTATATLPPSIDPNLCDRGSGESKADTDADSDDDDDGDNCQSSSEDANNDEKTEEAVVTVATEDEEEETVAAVGGDKQMLVDDNKDENDEKTEEAVVTVATEDEEEETVRERNFDDSDDLQPLNKRRKGIPKKDANKEDANMEKTEEKTEDEEQPDDEDDDEDAGDDDDGEAVWENEDEKTDRIVWKLEWLDFILKIENIEPITLGDLLSLLYKPTRDAVSCMVDICCRDGVLPLNSFLADGEDITKESIELFEGNVVSNAVYIGK